MPTNNRMTEIQQMNLDNPFIYMAYMSTQKLYRETTDAIKRFVVAMAFLGLTVVIEVIISIISNSWNLWIIGLLLVFSTIMIYELRDLIRNSNSEELNQLLYSPEFTYIRVNNEEIMYMIAKIQQKLGKSEYLKDQITFFSILYTVIFAIKLLYLMTFIFK